MSLVSYAASDESSDDESNVTNELPSSAVIDKDPHERYTKEEDSIALAKPVGKKDDELVECDTNEETTKPRSIGNLFSSLPAPWMSSVSWASKGKSNKNQKRQAGQQTVKITLPVAEDSDSDDEAPLKDGRKQVLSSQKPSGLFSLLPKPKHSVVVKENNPNRPATKVTNRALIPDSLRRKNVKNNVPNQLESEKKITKGDSDDDDEEDGGQSVSFFSLEEKDTPITLEGDKESKQEINQDPKSNKNEASTSRIQEVSLPNLNDTSASTNVSLGYPEKTPQQFGTSAAGSSQSSSIQSGLDSYQVQRPSTYPNAHSYAYEETAEDQAYPTSYSGVLDANSDYSHNSNMTTEPYYNYNYAQPDATVQETNHGVEWWQQVEPTAQNNERHSEQFKKLHGKRGRNEEIMNIIDVNADDQVGPSSEWKSRYRRDDTGYQPQSKKKGNLPSAQQRRKHQITYLAFQAKEAEWELRNQWAANQQTRRQTQSKYGF